MTSVPGSVLISSAGRRVNLVRFFQRAMRDHAVDGRVLVSDANPDWSAAARVADVSIRVPLVSDPDYRASLVALVRREGIRLIVPTVDTELLQLARMRDELRGIGCEVSVSDAAVILASRDKRRSDVWFREMGFETPEIYAREALRFPCFVKPYDGSLSRGARALLTRDMLSGDLLADDHIMFMELLSSAEFDEYTVDAYYSRTGALKCLVPRQRVEVRGGEISKGVARKGPTFDYLRARLGRVTGARGCLTFQFFASRAAKRWVAIELNARFGGGYPLSYAAGANYPEWLVREYFFGEDVPEFDTWRDRTAMVRYDDEVVFELSRDQ